MKPGTKYKLALAFLAILMFACSQTTPTPRAATKKAVATRTPFPTRTKKPTRAPTETVFYKPISWMELQSFLSKDHTNWNEYTEEYNCVNYAMDLVANASEQDIHAWLVAVDFKDDEIGHVFVAFETTNKGIVWIEPQSDYALLKTDVGKPLCHVTDTSYCMPGIISKILDDIECNPITHDCWEK